MAGARPASKSSQVDGQRGVVNQGGPPPCVQAPQRTGVGKSGVEADRGIDELTGGRRGDIAS